LPSGIIGNGIVFSAHLLVVRSQTCMYICA
jgi:hypothetical protein